MSDNYNNSEDPLDELGLDEAYESLFNSRQQRRQRRRTHVAREAKRIRIAREIDAIADAKALEGEFDPTYRPSQHEAGWLLNSLRDFFRQELITDVLAMVKGGKEANVYCCAGHESGEGRFLAAKVYRPHVFRQIRNDAVYREGRQTLGDGGTAIVRDQRTFRAMKSKTRHGRLTKRVSWLMHEYNTQRDLYELGADVPRMWASGENALLMEFVGAEGVAAPLLASVALEPDEAGHLLQRTLHNIELMLSIGKIHGDLSAYNILYWEGQITIIDFPQAVNAHGNRSAAELLHRDVQRVCDYFARQGVAVDADAEADRLWRRYLARDPEEVKADLSRLEVSVEAEDDDED